MRKLERRKDNANDTILLLEDGWVIGAWDTTPCVLFDLRNPGDLDDWDGNNPELIVPEEYGSLVDSSVPV